MIHPQQIAPIPSRLLFALGAIVVAGIIAFIIWWKEGHGGHGLGDQTLKYSYIVSAVMFILGLKGLSSPKRARRGMRREGPLCNSR